MFMRRYPGDGGGLDGDIKSGAAGAGVGGAVEGDGGEAVGAVAHGRWGVAPGGLAGGEGGVAEVGFAFVDADFAGADAGGDGPGEGVMAPLVPLRCKPDRAAGWAGWGCQLADSFDHLFQLDAGVVGEGVLLERQGFGFLFEISQALGQIVMRCDQLTQTDKGAHNINTHLNRLRAAEHIGSLNCTVLGEREWQRFGKFEFGEVVAICDHLGFL